MMTTVAVSTPAQLTAAINKARGGEEIVLAPGDYAAQRFIEIKYAQPVTLRSADPEHPARIAKLNMLNARNVVFQDIEFTRNRGGEPYWFGIVTITAGENIVFRRGSIHGSLNGNASDDQMGIVSHGTNGLNLTGVTFKQLNVALVLNDSTNLVVQGNSFSELATDSMEIPGTKGALIENNHFFNYQPNPGAHTDGIQCWTRNKKSACKDIIIRKNWFDSAPGKEFQGIFFGDEANIGGYDRIEISNNKFNATMWHAIFVGAGSDIVIKDNVITAGPTMKPWIKTASPATVTGNSAPAYIIAGSMKVPKGNKIGGLFKR
ncbi:hypothetical protein A7X12_09450 [Sphingomonas sp. TDK1]|nr:hypothetical protein A7X12_09450 [Sphingomonas sp. TDK1]